MSKHNLIQAYIIKYSEGLHVGDHVQFKSWDEMAKEYGIDDAGDIPCQFIFTRHMKELCGEIAIITEIVKDNMIYLDFFSSPQILFCPPFMYSKDMLKRIKKSDRL